jgi:amidase
MVLFEQALADAAELDRYIEVNGRPKGPLHGLPISVKEHIDLFGTPSTAGLISQAEAVSSEDALIVKVLREAGAVFHVKTTNPQTLMACFRSSLPCSIKLTIIYVQHIRH